MNTSPNLKVISLIGLGVILVAAAVYGGYRYSQRAPQTTTTNTSTQQVTATSPSAEAISQSPNPMGQDAIITADTSMSNGPWTQSLYVATSTDAKTFSGQKSFQSRAGVVSAISDASGKLYAAFQYFPENDAKNFDKVAIKTSTDNGATWSDPTPAVFKNYPKSYSRPFDPTLALTPEGKIRMYFTVNTSSSSILSESTGYIGYYSAISTDGITYEFESGKRFSIDGKNVIDSAITYFDKKWHLIASLQKETGQDGTYYYATSTDGLTFSQPTQIATKSGDEWTGNMVVVNDKLRFYGSTLQGAFYSELGSDGTWQSPVTTNMKGGDPSVVKIKSGNYLGIYTGPSSLGTQPKTEPAR